MFSSLVRVFLPKNKRSRWMIAGTALAAVACLVAALLTSPAPVRVPAGPRGLAILPAGSFGSLGHYPLGNQGGTVGGGAPRPRVLAHNVAAVPFISRAPHRAALRRVHRVRELTGLRDEFTRVYELSDGRRQAVISSEPVNYRDGSGRWQPIDTAVVRSSRTGIAFQNTTNTFATFFGTRAGELVRFDAPGAGSVSIGAASTPASTGAVAARASGDTVLYSGLGAGVSLRYQVTPAGLKEGLVLGARSAGAEPFTFTMRVSVGLVPSQLPDGAIVLSRDGTGGRPVLVIPAPVMTDSRPDKASPLGYAFTGNVSQHAAWDAATRVLTVTMTPDAVWLNAPGRVFPVTIDPTIDIAPGPADAQNTMIISDQGQSSSNFSSSWRLSVGTDPAGPVRSLLSFPLSAVPAGTQLDSAELELYYDQNFGTAASNETIEAHQATAAWSAVTATWSNASNNVGQLGGNQVTVASSNPSQTAINGAWQTAIDPNAIGGSYLYNQYTSIAGTGGSATFTWIPALTEAGNYQVETHYVASQSASAGAAYTVNYSGGSHTYTVSQRSGSGGVWTTLGTQPFQAGTAGSVAVAGPTTTKVNVQADAVRLTLPGTATFNPALNTWNMFPVRNIVQSWLDGTSPNYGFVVKAANESALNVGGPRYEGSQAAYNGETATYPRLVLTYGIPGVALDPPTVIHATGAELSWPAYVDPTPAGGNFGTDENTGDDLAGYRVYRSVSQTFTPSADTLIASLPAGTTSFTDTTATPTPPGAGAAPSVYFYMVAVKTADGTVLPGPVQRAQLPTAGSTTVVIPASADTTLSSAKPATNEQHLTGQPYLGVGDNSGTYGVTRTVTAFPSMASAGIPADATITDARLRMWGWYNYNTGGGPASYEAHALTQSFDPATASWNNASAGTAWTSAGGAFSAAALGTASGLTTDPARQEWQVTSTVRDWLANPSDEHGLLVKLAGESASSAQERELFLDSSASEPKLGPQLVVTYTEPTAADTYYVPQLPDPIGYDSTNTVNVTLTNTTGTTLASADWVLSYHWLLPDGTDISDPANQAQTALPADLAPGAVTTIAATLHGPDYTGDNSLRQGCLLAWDLYNKTTGTWLSAGTIGTATGVQSLQQSVPVDQPTSNKIGLEKFYQYTGVNTGAGSAVLDNLATGNAVWSYNAFSNPSRGFQTFVRMTYNSLDTSDSAMGFGWSLEASTVQRLGTPLDFHPRPHPTEVTLTDGDGTSHTFTLASDGVTWQTPPGLHLFLQQVGACDPNGKTDNARAWVMTRPDRTQFFFDCQGFQTAVVDNNGNEADFTYTERKSNNEPVKFLDSITDPAGRQTLTITYYAKGDSYQFVDDTGAVQSATGLTDPFIIDQVKSITDISGRTITFLYDTKGLMSQMADGDGTSLAKVFKFGYDPTQGNKNVKLVTVTDPRGNKTSLVYDLPSTGDNPAFHWFLKTVTDRRGGTVGFTYTTPDANGNTTAQVTDQNGHATTYVLDSVGRPVQSTNALNQVMKLAYDADNNVTGLTEDNGATTTWTYDQNTGYPLTMTDPVAGKSGGPPTTFTYATGLSGHIAELTSKLTPMQRFWTFSYDNNGNLLSVTDPDGNTSGATAGSFTTHYTYDAFGELATSTDANGHMTTYTNYDPSGYPGTISDPLQNATNFSYDVRGNVITVTDPLGHATHQQYDVFGRPEQTEVPKDQAGNQFITTPAPVYDGNDNVMQATAPNGAVTAFSYDANDDKTAQFLPQDSPSSAQRETTYTYDPAGNLTSMTEPDGNVPSPASSFTTTYAYDLANERVSQTDAAGGLTTYSYDDVGNLAKVVNPVENATPGNTTAWATYAYDLDHRQTSTTDAAGFSTSQAYDLDGLVTSTTDKNGNTTLFTLDPRGKVTQVMVPHDSSVNPIVYDTTQYVYDQVGNLITVISPRGVASGIAGAYTQQMQYDADNRLSAVLSAFNPQDPNYGKASETDYTYDAAGRLAQVSAPSSDAQTIRNVTTYTYFDNGWTRSATDPWGITTSYDYNNLGQQVTRTIAAAGETACPVTSMTSDCRTLSSTYFLDGNLQSRSDSGVPTGLATELVDDSDSNNTASTGTWTATSAGTGFFGPGYQTHAPGVGIDTFTWNLNVPQDGNYSVFVRYPAVSGAASNASFKVSFSGGSSTVAVDQTQNAGTWVSLGKFAFTQNGAGQSVSLTENASGTVVADAVKIVRDNSGDTQAGAHSFSYAYDPNGNLTGITDGTPGTAISDYQVSYDGMNRISQVAEITPSGATAHTTTYGYDRNGDITSRTHDGAPSSYAYDARDLLSKETDATSATDPSPQVTSFAYTNAGQLFTEVKPNGNTVTDAYFADGSLQHSLEVTSGGATVAEHTYTYDPNGNKLQDIEKLMSADDNSSDLSHTLAYSYDPRDRVTQVTKDGTVTEFYAHDANDNVTSQTINGVTTSFTIDRNRLLAAQTNGVISDYNYDPFGRLDTVTSGGQVVGRNTYDGFDHIVEHQQLNSGGTLDATSYTYDPLDRKTAQTTGVGTGSPQTTGYAYIGLSGQLVSELQGGTTVKSYTYTPGGTRLSQTTLNSTDPTQKTGYYTYNDHSDVQAVTGTDGNTKSTYGYTAYGQNDTTQFTGKDKNNTTPGSTSEPFSAYRYNAKRWDSSSGQYDMGFRNYDPALNQFLSRDMFNGGLADVGLDTDPFTGNRYTFGAGNPVSNIELTGHQLITPGDGGGCDNTTPGCPGPTSGARAILQPILQLTPINSNGGNQQPDLSKADPCTNAMQISLVRCSPQTTPNVRPDLGFCIHLASELAQNACGVDFGEFEKQVDSFRNPLRQLQDALGGGPGRGFLDGGPDNEAAPGGTAGTKLSGDEKKMIVGGISGCAGGAAGGVFTHQQPDQIFEECAFDAALGAAAAAAPGGVVGSVVAGAAAGAATGVFNQLVANNGTANFSFGVVAADTVIGGGVAVGGGVAAAKGAPDLNIAVWSEVAGIAIPFACSLAPLPVC